MCVCVVFILSRYQDMALLVRPFMYLCTIGAGGLVNVLSEMLFISMQNPCGEAAGSNNSNTRINLRIYILFSYIPIHSTILQHCICVKLLLNPLLLEIISPILGAFHNPRPPPPPPLETDTNCGNLLFIYEHIRTSHSKAIDEGKFRI